MDKKILAIQKTQRATEQAMAAVITYLRKSKSPTSEVARDVIAQTLKKFDCGMPHGVIVAGGRQSAAPHAPGRGRLSRGCPIVIDIFPYSKRTGYFADMSRTVCLGNAPAELQKMYDAVLEAQTLAIQMVRPGARCADIQKAVETFFTERGFVRKGTRPMQGEGFIHGVGHGVGKAIHEAPRIGKGSKDMLTDGDVITIEPGLYYKKVGGVRIEDMLVVTARGCRNLTRFPKKLIL